MTEYQAEIESEIKSLSNEAFAQASAGIPTLEKIDRWLERQDLSADVKSILSKIARTVAKAGSTVLHLGRIVFQKIMEVCTAFPNTIIGVVIGAVVGALIASVPLVGGVLGVFFSPLLIAMGLSIGAIEDLKDRALERRIKASVEEMSILNSKNIR